MEVVSSADGVQSLLLLASVKLTRRRASLRSLATHETLDFEAYSSFRLLFCSLGLVPTTTCCVTKFTNKVYHFKDGLFLLR